jgi:hypothetical protein
MTLLGASFTDELWQLSLQEAQPSDWGRPRACRLPAQRPGANLRELMARAGQSSPAAALRYLHEVDGRQREIADQLAGFATAGNVTDPGHEVVEGAKGGERLTVSGSRRCANSGEGPRTTWQRGSTPWGNSMPCLTAGIIFHQDALDELVVIDSAGNPLAERPIPERVTGLDGWDRAVLTPAIGG